MQLYQIIVSWHSQKWGTFYSWKPWMYDSWNIHYHSVSWSFPAITHFPKPGWLIFFLSSNNSLFEWIDQARACVLEIMPVSAELTAHLDETICFGWILNVVLRKTTIRNFPLTNKLIILRTRRQLLFRLPFFSSYFLIIWIYLGSMRINTPRMLRKYLVFSKLIRYFCC